MISYNLPTSSIKSYSFCPPDRLFLKSKAQICYYPLIFIFEMQSNIDPCLLFLKCLMIYGWHELKSNLLANNKKTRNSECWQGCRKKREPLFTVGGNVNWCNQCGKQYGGSLKTKNRTSIWSSYSTSGYDPNKTKILMQNALCTPCLWQHYLK